MAESIVDIVLRIKNDTAAVISSAITDLKTLQSVSSSLSAPEVSKLAEDLGQVGEASVRAESGITDLGSGLDKVAPGATRAATSLTDLRTASERAGDAALEASDHIAKVGPSSEKAKAGLDSVGSGVSALTNAVPNLIQGVKGLATAFAGLVALNFLKGFADDAAKAQVAGTVLNVIALNAGITSTAIQQVDQGIQKLGITAVDSRESLTKFIQAGLEGLNNESLGKAKELARAAQDLAVVSGQNSSETFSRMIVNIQQMDTMGMRFMGITVDRARAEQAYAGAIGKTTAELTQQDQRQAFMNETLKEAAKLTGTYEAAMGDVAKQISSLARLKNELSKAIGDNLLPAYSALVEQFTLFLKEAKLVAEVEGQQGQNAKAMGEAIREVATVIRGAASWLMQHAELVKAVAMAWLGLKVIGIITPIFVGLLSKAALLTEGFTVLWLAMKAGFPASLAAQAAMTSVGAEMGILGARITSLRTLATGANIGGALMAGFAGFEVGTLLNKFAVVRNAAATGVSGTATLYNLLFGSKQEYEASKQILKEDLDNFAKGYDSEAMEKQSKGTQDLRDKSQELIAILEKRADLEREYSEAQKGVGSRTKEAVKDELDKSKAAEQSVRAAMDQIAAESDVSSAKKNQLLLQEEGIAKSKLQTKQLAAEVQALKDAQQRLGFTDEAGGKVTEKFADDVKAFERTYAAAFKLMEEDAKASGETIGVALKRGSGVASEAFKEVSFEFDALLAKAKTPEELSKAFESVAKFASVMGERVLAARETLQFRAEKASLDQINTAMQGFTENIKTLRGALETAAMLSDDNAKSQQKWREVMIGLGGSFTGFAGQVTAVNDAMKLFADTTTQQSASAKSEASASMAAAQQKYQAEEALLAATTAKRRAFAEAGSGGEKVIAIALTAIDKESLQQRITNAKGYYTSLKSLQAESLNLFKTYADKVKELDKAIFNAKESKESDLREIRRKGMTEEEVQADKMLEYNQLIAKAEEATKTKSYEKAAEYASKAKELAKGLGGDLEEQAALVGKAWDVSIEAQTKQKEEAKKAAQEQLDTYKELSNSLDTMSSLIKKLTGEQIAKILINIDEESLTAGLKKVQDAFGALEVKVKVSPDSGGSVPGFASGGLIKGPGTDTSDSILAAVSRNEFINKARSVRHYGVDLFHALNNMTLPRSALRAALSGGIPRFNTGGLVGGSAVNPRVVLQTPDYGPTPAAVELNLTFNRKPIGKVAGSRDSINNLVSALTELSRGT